MIQKIKTQLIKFIFSKLNFQISDSLLISIILHIFLLIVMLVSPYIYTTSKIKKIKTSDPIIVDLENFKIGSKTIVTPIHVSQNKKEMSKKEQNKSEKKKYFKSEIKTK